MNRVHADLPGWSARHTSSCIVAFLLVTIFLLPGVYAENNPGPVSLHILAVNDFHGQVVPGQSMNGSQVGSIPVIGAYLRDAAARYGKERTIIALPGDMTGASPAESGLLLDEPAILFFNGLASNDWRNKENTGSSGIRVIGTVGNHEFDRNVSSLLRLLGGGDGNTTITHLVDPYPGALWPVVVSNIYRNDTGELLYPPSRIENVDSIPVAFIGAVTLQTPDINLPADVEGISFTDEADAINKQVAALQKEGIHAFVVLLHEGGEQTPYDGETREIGDLTGRVAYIIPRLDKDVDLVLSGHTHEFTNEYLPNAGGEPTLVTQAYSYGKAYADIGLELDPESGDVINKTAAIIPFYANQSPASPDPDDEELLNATLAAVNPLIDEVIATTKEPLTRDLDANGESALYDLAADSMRWSMETDMAIIQTGALRADIKAGDITTGSAYSVMPFHDQVFTIRLTGAEIRDLLTQQWNRTVKPDHILEISGFSYAYNPNLSLDDRVISITRDGKKLDMDAWYTVATTDFLAGGGDGYSVMKEGEIVTYGPIDVDIFIDYLKSIPSPVQPEPYGRIRVSNGGS